MLKEDLQKLALHLNLPCDPSLTKKELSESILKFVATRGGVPNLNIKGVAVPLYAKQKPQKPAKKIPSTTGSIALSTSVEMMKDQLASTLAQNALSAKGLAPRVVTALSAALDATAKVNDTVKSDERKRRP